MTPEDAFLQLAESMFKKVPMPVLASVSVGVVAEVDKGKRTCTVKRDGKPTLHDVRLNSVIGDHKDHCTVFPKINSYVLCQIIDKTTNCFLLAIAEPEEIAIKIGNSELKANKDEWIFNNGSLGGMVKINELVQKLNTLENQMGVHQHLYTNAAGVITPTMLDSATNSPITPTQKTELENAKIKQ